MTVRIKSPHSTVMLRYSGDELRTARRDRRLTQTAVAEAMGVGQGRISAIEGMAVVPPAAADRYIRALLVADGDDVALTAPAI